MEDNGLLTSRIINKNWVLKRKRRKIPFSPDTSNKNNCAPSESHTNSLPTLEDNIASARSSSKKKGHDGYYYECAICDLGGNLLCCDSCPETYHLQCLDPPLKRIPNGKWQCPKCCLKNNPVDATVKVDFLSKRARTKVVVGKSKTGNKSVKNDKISRISGSSITGKKGSSSKGKSSLSHTGEDASCDNKLSHPSDDGSVEGNSSFSNVDDGKKMESSLNDAVKETKSGTELKTKEETSGKKSDQSCGEESAGNNDVPKLVDVPINKARKRKRKVPFGDVQKKPRTDEGKSTAENSQKRGSKAKKGIGISKPQRKRKSVNGASASLPKKSVGREDVESLKNETVLQEAANETGKVEVERVTNKDHTPDEVQQVDRVLGCRIQGSVLISMAETTETHPDDLVDLDIRKRPSEGNPSCNLTSHMVDPENLAAGVEDNLSHSDGQNRIEDDTRLKNIDKSEIPLTNDCGEKDSMPDMITSDVKNPVSTAVNDEIIGTPALTEQILTGGDISVDPGLHDKSELGEGCQRPSSPDIPAIKGVDVETETISSHKKRNKESVLIDSLSSHGESVSFEFLVKWVGKSHIHNSWISESRLKVLAKRKLDNYKAKYGTAVMNICEEQWKIPQRVIALHSSANGLTEVFVKWAGLPYDECTWEKIDEPTITKSSHLIDLFLQFERQAVEKDDDKLRKQGHTQTMDVVNLNDQPKELVGGSLFPHQLEALNWLRKCWQISKNVILADEMGLGKTVSALSFISSLNFEFKVRLPCLVLVPLSTMPNWMAEFSLWAPNLNVVEYHGGAKARALIRQYEWHGNIPDGSNKKTGTYKFNVLLTTYEMVLADSSHLRGVPWEVLVVDEGHRLKNSSSKLFGMLNTFSFQHRVLLTGTPLQNNLGEMYNLLNFLQPASFPSLSSFEEKFNDLTTTEKVEELKKLVAPHMLRRLKKDVMQNIPPKTERMVPVELSSLQAKYYRAMLTKNYQLLRNIGKGVGQQSMMNIVMQLRKICNHPYLIQGTEPEDGSVEFLHDMRITASAKLTLLHSMLRVLHRDGHRVLIFSQMTKLLDILEDYLNIEFGPKTFERVDGSVSVADRQTAIARFNQDKNRFVFLLSTRSCGLGINLATADTVIIYDSDFNPHADIQAMNRAHRIGQSKRLLVYRLVVRASVEERILQLAKKKLMLDQLFVNKSESQKEVEDILRWGTEELFNDFSSVSGKDSGEDNNKDEAFVEVEHKHKRRTGGLGDVYQDKCTDGHTKIVWDENAIMKLLDRSTLQSGSPDNAEGDVENDMLGSVKSLEWTEEPIEEQGGTELLPLANDDDTSAQNSKKEDTSVIPTEENEWDRLLKVRWEDYQREEEAALGRGKRQRKAVSYKEAYPPHPIETLNESGAAEQPAPEPEPEREYTPAGRALKTKYSKLRARQKERLAQRSAAEASFLAVGPTVHESFPYPSSNGQDGNSIRESTQHVAETALTINIDASQGQTSEVPKSKPEKSLRMGKNPNLKMSSQMKHFGPHVLDHFLPNNRLQGTDCVNSVPSNNLLPVLGLCAPNATQMESTQRNISRSFNKQRRHGVGTDFPFHIAPCSRPLNEIDEEGHGNMSDKFKLPNMSSDSFQHQQKTSIPDHSLPFSSHNLADPRGKGLEASESSGAFPDYHKLPFNEAMLPELPFPGRNFSHLNPHLFSGLSLGSRIGGSNNSSAQELPTMPLLPNLKFPQDTPLYYNQPEMEIHPTLGLGQMLPSSLSALPENHRKVLENIMMRTGSGGSSSNLSRKKQIKDYWSEDELDFLWIGVRRHGRGSWDSMLKDPRLKFSNFRTAEDLSSRWEEEQLKISDTPSIPTQKSTKAGKSRKSPSQFPSISDGMMKRALHGSRFAGPLQIQPHLTDMKLGFGDFPSSLIPHPEASDRIGLHNENLPPIPTWNSEKFRANFSGDPSVGPSDRPATSSNVQMEHPFMLNSLGTSNLGFLGLNGSSSGLNPPLKEDELRATRPWRFPTFPDQSLNLLRVSRNNEAENSALENVSDKLKGKDEGIVGNNNSPETKLPHWLRQAVSAPSTRPTEVPDLPPTVSAIAQSVRLLYGDESPTIPPFVVPGLPPSRPKDPRISMKKKKKKKHRSSSFVLLPQDYAASSSTVVNRDPSFPLLPQMMGTSDFPSPGLNMLNLASSSLSVPSNLKKKTSTLRDGLSPSPEVLKLVASSMLPLVPGPGSTSSSLPESETRLDSREQEKQDQDQAHLDPPLGSSPDEMKTEETASGDSSKTPSDPSRRQQLGGDKVGDDEEEEVSSEETVSDHRVSDHES